MAYVFLLSHTNTAQPFTVPAVAHLILGFFSSVVGSVVVVIGKHSMLPSFCVCLNWFDVPSKYAFNLSKSLEVHVVAER